MMMIIISRMEVETMTMTMTMVIISRMEVETYTSLAPVGAVSQEYKGLLVVSKVLIQMKKHKNPPQMKTLRTHTTNAGEKQERLQRHWVGPQKHGLYNVVHTCSNNHSNVMNPIEEKKRIRIYHNCAFVFQAEVSSNHHPSPIIMFPICQVGGEIKGLSKLTSDVREELLVEIKCARSAPLSSIDQS